MIYGPDGKPIKTIHKPRPIVGAVAVADRFDRFSSHPSERLSPQKLGGIFKEAEAGNIRRQMELFEEIEEKDTHLFSQLQTRKNAVAGLDWSILPASDDAKDQEIANFVGDILYEFEDMDDLILDLLDAIGKGFSVCEILWAYEQGRVVPRSIPWRHPKKFCFDDLDELRVLTEENRAQGIPLPPNKFIVHQYKARSGSPTRAGVLRVAVWMYLFKNYAIKDWLAFSEVYGMPIRLGRYEPGTSQEDKDALIAAVQAIGADAAGVISKDSEIQFIESIRSDGILYHNLVKLCNAEISKAVLGQTLTSEPGESGSYSLGKTHNLVRQDILESDSKGLQKTLKRDLIRPLVEFNYGAGCKIPWLKLGYESPEDMVQEASKYQTLVGGLGLPVAQEHIYEKFGIPMPEKGQTLLQPPSAAPNMGGLGAYPFRQVAAKAAKIDTGQQATDQLGDNALGQAVKAVNHTLQPFYEVIAQAQSLEEMRDRLIAAYRDLPEDELADLLQKAIFIADLNGRASVLSDG